VNTERWRRIREVFDHVAELPTGSRETALDELAEDDAELRSEVLDLLAALEDDTTLDRGPWAAFSGEDLSGTILGSYRVEERVGRGGMGDVYLAHRSDGQFDRRVAIKLIKPGMDTVTVLRRFRQERRILAGLNHPSIAALIDGGVTGSGRPYFVMEYVDGEPVTAYCTRTGLSVEARVRLFRDVCDAVHFAHQNLVIHRDLKPGNILVTPDGAVKLLDFGVAKLLRQDESEHTLTAAGGRALTPSYASPEQVRGEQVTTSTDVYSLGVILYELLALRRPFRFEHGSIAEAIEVVGTQEPTRPSAALDDEPTQPEHRDMRRALRRKLEGDLDNIVLKAIRKEPARRYTSAHELAEDLGRYLEGRPVTARKDTFGYRFGKFVGRHRAGVAAATVATIALALGAWASATQAQRASIERALSLQRMQNVRELANSLLFEVHDAVADLPGATEARRLILERGFHNLEELAVNVRGDPELEYELAEAYVRVGLVQGQPTGASLGDLSAAEASHTRAVEIAQALVDDAPDNTRAIRTLALALEKRGDVRAWTGRVEEGVGDAQRALDGYRALAVAMPDSARHQLSLAISLIKLADLTGNPYFPNLGRPDQALGHYDEARLILARPPLGPSADWGARRQAALVDERIGNMQRNSSRFEEAKVALQRSLAAREGLAAEQPANTDARRDIGVTHQNLCEVDLSLGSNTTALRHCEAANEIYHALHSTDPSNAQGVSDVAVGSISLAGARYASNDPDGALATIDISIDMLRGAVEAEPDNVPNRLMLARALARHTAYAIDSGRPSPHATEARALLAALASEGRTHADDLMLLAWIEDRLGVPR
jgi:tRNA A-37 threonylcarbamoyl transferase component Bud32/tetratricopeptide (TPR) repeat protein